MKQFEIHLGCIYQHVNGSVCCVERIEGEDIYVLTTTTGLKLAQCKAFELNPMLLDDYIIDFSSMLVGESSFDAQDATDTGTSIKRTKRLEYVHEFQLLIQISFGIDIHEVLFNHIKNRQA